MKTLGAVWIAMAAIGAGAVPASAADMPVKAAWVAPPPTWSGCYIGINGGGGSTHKRYTDPLVPPAIADLGRHTGTGAIGGGQVGCDIQYGSWVFGVQSMVDGTHIKGEHGIPGDADVFTTKIPWLATATGRAGFTVMQNGLIYVKGGGAWVRDREVIFDGPIPEARANLTRSGWTIGGGLEVLTGANWSMFVEYNHLDFGTRRTTFTNLEIPPVPPTFPLNIRQSMDMVAVGVNYRFNWLGSGYARY
jgi:outer membrane immunogenic protein